MGIIAEIVPFRDLKMENFSPWDGDEGERFRDGDGISSSTPWRLRPRKLLK
jgi:hypothetical protein